MKPGAVLTGFGVAWCVGLIGGGLLDHAGNHQLSKIFLGAIAAAVGTGLVLNLGNASAWAGDAMFRQRQGTRWAPASSSYAFGLWRMGGALCIFGGLILLVVAVVAPTK